MNLIELNNISKQFKMGSTTVNALSDISLTIQKGEMVAITGPSGSGKTTLMNIIGLLDRPTGGEYRLGNQLISMDMSDQKLARLRSEKIGFVFQTFNLLPRLSALGNVLLPTSYCRAKRTDRKSRAIQLLTLVGLEKRIQHRPAELSGGERQRIAIARALINDPDIILADEPTGNLDSKTGREIISLLAKLNEEEGKTVLIITHDDKVSAKCQRSIRILDGQLDSRKLEEHD